MRDLLWGPDGQLQGDADFPELRGLQGALWGHMVVSPPDSREPGWRPPPAREVLATPRAAALAGL
jgi:hypothetical protein